MRFIWDHDLHIHSNLSTCANDPEQTPQNILAYAQRNGLTAICLTDHFWDERVCTVQDSDPSYHFPSFYKIENFSHISKVAPLPQAPGVRFLFGCETELDRNMTLGLSKERMDLFDFIVIPTTHLHFNGFTISDSSLDAKARAALWSSRLDGVLHMDLPFHSE